MNLVSLLAERAAEHPDRPALIETRGGRDISISYGELSRRVAAGAASLGRTGLLRGSVILVFQPVSIRLYEILLAAFHAGMRVMLADPSAGREFLAHCCRRLPPDAFFGPWKAQFLRLLVPEMRRIPLTIRPGAWKTGGPPAALADVSDDEPALVTFTSGSTGVPKAAVRTHGFLLAQHRTLSRSLGFAAGEVDLITLPVFVLANLASGLTSVIAATDLRRPGSPDAAAVATQCARLGVTRCAASPAFFEGLLAAEQLPHFAKVFTGGAPVFPDLLKRLRDALPAARIEAVYGSTEAEPIAHISADDAEPTRESTRHGSGLCAGFPVPDIALEIIADCWGTPLGPMDEAEFLKLTVPPGAAGEIVVSGDHVLRGYLDGIGDEETKIRVGAKVWHRTGDAGWLDDAGRLWLLGRAAEKLPLPDFDPGGIPEISRWRKPPDHGQPLNPPRRGGGTTGATNADIPTPVSGTPPGFDITGTHSGGSRHRLMSEAPAGVGDVEADPQTESPATYPFAIECALRELFPGIRTAALDWQGERTLAVGKRCTGSEADDIRAKAAEFAISRVMFLDSLPLDRRHNAKIDYPALRAKLGR